MEGERSTASIQNGHYVIISQNLLLNREHEQGTAIFEEFDHLIENFYCKSQNNNYSAYVTVP